MVIVGTLEFKSITPIFKGVSQDIVLRRCFFTDSTSYQRNYRFCSGRVPSHVYMAAQFEAPEEDWLDNGAGPRYLVSICSTFLFQKFLKAHKVQFYGRYDYQSGANKISGSKIKIRLHVWVLQIISFVSHQSLI